MSTHAARHVDRLRRALAAVLLLAGSGHALALPGDSDQPISIAADRAEHDDARRITIYRGNVEVDQGSLHLTGDNVTIQFDGSDEVAKITVLGAPAHFRQSTGAGAGQRKAWAQRMEYFPGQDLIMLLGEARYEKDGSHVRADRLVYDSRNERFKALTDTASDGDRTDAKAPERVRIEIRPKKDASQ